VNGITNPDRNVADAQRLSELLREASATVTSEDHSVTVTARPGNVVTSIELAQQARRHSGAELGEQILTTVKAAIEQLNRELLESASELGPSAVDAVTTILGSPTGASPSAIQDPPGLDELTAGFEDADPFDDLTSEERDYLRQSGAEDEIRAAQEQFAKLQRDAEQQLAAFDEIQQRIAGQTATATSPDGHIEVTVKHGTGVTGIEIGDDVLRHGPSRVGPMVLATIQRATAQLALATAAPAQDYAGSRMNVRDLVERYQPEDDEADDDPKSGRR
jgi:DNA-binding protein YbaB